MQNEGIKEIRGVRLGDTYLHGLVGGTPRKKDPGLIYFRAPADVY